MLAQPSPLILYINPSPTSYTVFSRILGQGQYKLLETTGAPATWQLLANTHPDLIIIEIDPANPTGLNLCQHLKTQPTYSEIPILLLAEQFTDPLLQAKATTSGADGYLTCSMEPLALLSTIKAFIRARQAEVTLRHEQQLFRQGAKATDDILKRRVNQLALLNDIGSRLTSVLNVQEVMERATQLVHQKFGYHHVAIFTMEPKEQELVMQARAGAFAHLFPHNHRLKTDQGMVGWVSQHRKSLLANNVKAEPRYINFFPEQIPTQAELSIPIQIGKQSVGVLDIQSPQLNAFDENDVLVMLTLASQIAVALENAMWFETVKRELIERRQVEDALRQSEGRSRALLAAIPDLICRVDSLGNYLEVKLPANFQPIFAHDDVIGKPLANYFSPKQSTILLEHIRKASERKELQQIELDYEVNGQLVNREIRFAPYAPGEVAIMIRDITARKQMEATLRHRNRELDLLNRVIAASASAIEPEAILETVCHELAQFFDLPQAAAALFDANKTTLTVKAEYLANQGASLLNLSIPSQHLPADLMSYKAPLIFNDVKDDPRLACMQERLKQQGIVAALVCPIMIDGELAGTLGLAASEARHFKAEEISLTWSVADQVAGAIARARLTQAHQRLSAALEQAGESIAITDPAGKITYVNPTFEQVTGYNRSEVLGCSHEFLESGFQSPEFYQQIWATLAAKQIWHGRFINRKKDGALYTENATIAPVLNSAQEIVNFVFIKRDITNELRLEEQMRQAQKMDAVGRLAGGIAHDLNNLLLVINGVSDLLLTEFHDHTQPTYQDLCQIKQTGERAAMLIRQLLTFSRKQVLQLEQLDLNAVITDIYKMLRRLIREDIEIVTHLSPILGPIKADRGQLGQVIMNLAINARDAMPAGGQLTLATTNVTLDQVYASRFLDVEPGPYALLTISDTGIGMNSDTVAHIFEPFFTTKSPGEGTGLGLAIVHGIIKQGKGHIEVESTPGQGTSFKIYLPRLVESTPAAGQEALLAELPQGSETILVVEDEMSVRELIKRILATKGYEVLLAGQGTEAIQMCTQEPKLPIDLVLTDIIMPGMNGAELATRLKQMQPELKIVYMTGYAENMVTEGLSEGETLINKPFTPTGLLHAIREVLDKV
jgi:PAS domain S-box-containing protein